MADGRGPFGLSVCLTTYLSIYLHGVRSLIHHRWWQVGFSSSSVGLRVGHTPCAGSLLFSEDFCGKKGLLSSATEWWCRGEGSIISPSTCVSVRPRPLPYSASSPGRQYRHFNAAAASSRTSPTLCISGSHFFLLLLLLRSPWYITEGQWTINHLRLDDARPHCEGREYKMSFTAKIDDIACE